MKRPLNGSLNDLGIEYAKKEMGTPLIKEWAELCGIDESDDRVIYGWPERFLTFREGWLAAKRHN